MKIFTLTLLAATSILASNPAFADTTAQCAPISKEQVAALFDQWNASLKTGNPDTVTANYSDDAVLLPTVSNKPRTNHAEIRDYFVDFLQKHPQGTIDSRTIKLGCNTATDMGIYTFKLKDGNTSKEVQARYTFQYAFENGKWVIEHHHSSAMPEKVTMKH
jgi:uncharacterized protein (TIGR02246 family)